MISIANEAVGFNPFSDSEKSNPKVSWIPEKLNKRREELTDWIIGNWGIDKHFQPPIDDILDDEEEDELIFND